MDPLEEIKMLQTQRNDLEKTLAQWNEVERVALHTRLAAMDNQITKWIELHVQLLTIQHSGSTTAAHTANLRAVGDNPASQCDIAAPTVTPQTPVANTIASSTVMRIGTFCEGPFTTFAEGLERVVGDDPDFKITVVSDKDEEFVNSYKSIPKDVIKVLDARDAASFAGLEIVCIVAPYSDKGPKATIQLCEDIAAAMEKSSSVKYVILVGRHQPGGEAKYGQPELYNPICKKFKLLKTLRPMKNDMRVCRDYVHYFTAKGVKEDTLPNGAFMHLSLLVRDGQKSEPRLLQPEEAERAKNPLRVAISTIDEMERAS